MGKPAILNVSCDRFEYLGEFEVLWDWRLLVYACGHQYFLDWSEELTDREFKEINDFIQDLDEWAQVPREVLEAHSGRFNVNTEIDLGGTLGDLLEALARLRLTIGSVARRRAKE